MSDIQDFYLGQIVNEGEMDTIYSDVTNAERNLAKGSQLSQAPAIEAHRKGGILSGLEVSFNSSTSVLIALGDARDSNGKRIGLPAEASVSLSNLGDTAEGDYASATGDGSLVASSITSGEAWLSLFIAFDTNLSDTRVDALNNSIAFRQTESFHFELMIGADSSAPATARPNLDDTRVLLADILLDNSGYIRDITGTKAICNSSYDMNKIGYGPDDTANLFGRRSDWIAIDPDGTDYELFRTAYDSSEPHNHAYHNLRGRSPRESIERLVDLYTTPGTASKAGGSEIIGGRPITGKTLSAPGAAAALQMPSGSIHTQLEALYDKVNTLASRGSDTLTGNIIIIGSLTQSGGTCSLGDSLNTVLLQGYVDHKGVMGHHSHMCSLEASIALTDSARAALSIMASRCEWDNDDLLLAKWARRELDPSPAGQYPQHVEDQWGLIGQSPGAHHRIWMPGPPASISVDYTADQFSLAFNPWNASTVPAVGYIRPAAGYQSRYGLLIKDHDGAHGTVLNCGSNTFRGYDLPALYTAFFVPNSGDKTKDWFYINIGNAAGQRVELIFDGGTGSSMSNTITLHYYDGVNSFTRTVRAAGHNLNSLYCCKLVFLDDTPYCKVMCEVWENGVKISRAIHTFDDTGPTALALNGASTGQPSLQTMASAAGGTGFVIHETSTSTGMASILMRPLAALPIYT